MAFSLIKFFGATYSSSVFFILALINLKVLHQGKEKTVKVKLEEMK